MSSSLTDPSTANAAPGSAEPIPDILIPDDTTFTIQQEKTNEGVARATGILALGNITSRILGLAREIALTNLFGASAAVDAFKVAILVPKGLFDLLIGGHVNGAIIPVLSEVATKDGRDELWRLVSILLNMLTAALAVLVILLEIGAPVIVRLFGSGFDDYTQALAVNLLRLTSPALIFMGMFAIISGTLYSLRVFAWSAFATAVFNASVVVVMLAFAPAPQYHFVFDGNHVVTTIARADSGIMVAAIGWLFGSVAYVLIQLPGMRGAKLHVTINWKHPAIRRIGLLYIPVMLSLIMDTLIIRPFSYSLASRTGEGNISYMDWATTLIQFPQGLVATAISIAILPTLSRQAALILPLHLSQTTESNDNRTAFKDTLGLGLRLAMTLILPAAVGLFVLATPIITLIFQHGAFHAADTVMTAKVLRLYLIGLPFAGIDLLLVYAFYARQDTLTPALVGVFSLIVYMVTALILFGRYGLFSLMIADSVKHIVHSVISGYLLRRRMGGFGDQRFLLTAGKTGLAALGMGITAAGALPILRDVIGSAGLIHEAALVAACGALSVGVFTVMAYILKLDEWRWLAGVIRRKLSGG